MSFDFDRPVNRRGSDSAKWGHYDDDVLPMWVADMDFVSPQPIMDAIRDRLDHGVFGYSQTPPELLEAICERMLRQQGWAIEPESILFIPGLVSGLNVVARAVGERGDGVLVNTPVYPPFLSAPEHQHRTLQAAEQSVSLRDGHLHYDIDFDALGNAADESSKLFILCNPHNPTGRA